MTEASGPQTGERPALQVQELVKYYRDRGDRVAAVAGVSFDVAPGGFFALLGPSGCGKTTTLRCIAGLERNEGGRIMIAGQVVSDGERKTFVAASRRRIGMVFQSYGIWPHMSVFENAAFPLRVARIAKSEVNSRVEEVLATVQLGSYAHRNATQLSGGQQQRLALARALVRRPELLLLDEPLSNLDAQLRESMRTEVRDLQHRLGITTLYVTHDQTEALSMADCVALMRDGKVVQQGPPRDIYERPATRFVADFVGKSNFIAGKVIADGQGGATVETAVGTLRSAMSGAPDSAVTLCIRPEHITLDGGATAGENIVGGRVETVTFLGERVDVTVAIGEIQLRTLAHAHLAPTVGAPVSVRLAPEHLTVLAS
ncbi:MAG: ABC transporter ATP-binding protein [Candidatus Dormibacteraeota bacterium]|nr:ABC transporter ATP-binding protein [Candidatus Dormibacteraeota bacterium]MBV9525176.1 ABC transporter ATP-binding protein [Candidatus Dormibacteraeota bacterium]